MKKIFKTAGFALFLSVLFTSCAEDLQVIHGCMDPESANYNDSATVSDGSCIEIAEVQNSLLIMGTANDYVNARPDVIKFEDVMNFAPAKGKILGIRFHVSGDYRSTNNDSLGLQLVDRFGPTAAASGVFILNNKNHGNGVSAATLAGRVIDTALVAPKVGTNLKWTVGAGANDGKINIDAYAKFFEAATAANKFYMGVYILMRQEIGLQDTIGGTDSNFVHRHVLLGAAHYSGLGELISSGPDPAGANSVVKLSYVVDIDPAWNPNNLEVHAIIWRREANGKFHYVNSTINN